MDFYARILFKMRLKQELPRLKSLSLNKIKIKDGMSECLGSLRSTQNVPNILSKYMYTKEDKNGAFFYLVLTFDPLLPGLYGTGDSKDTEGLNPRLIMKTCPCNYIAKLGYAGVYLFFSARRF